MNKSPISINPNDTQEQTALITLKTGSWSHSKASFHVEEVKIPFNSILEQLCSGFLSKDCTIEQVDLVYDTLSVMQKNIGEAVKIVEEIHEAIKPNGVLHEDVAAEYDSITTKIDETTHIQQANQDLSKYISEIKDNSFLVSLYQEDDEVFLPIPEKIMEQLNLKIGDEIGFEQQENGVIILRKHLPT